jgi:hypothetical protein
VRLSPFEHALEDAFGCFFVESIGKTKIDFRENTQAGFVAMTQREQNLSEAE